MKRLVVLLMTLAMSFSIGMISLAEETPESVTLDEEATYEEYFKSAFAIVEDTRNYIVDFGNFFGVIQKLNISKGNIADYFFVKDLNSPFELTIEQIQMLITYKEKCTSSSKYESFAESTLYAALHFCKDMPALFDSFEALKKPQVPDKYKDVDDCIKNAIESARNAYESFMKLMNGEQVESLVYDETYLNYLDIINDNL